MLRCTNEELERRRESKRGGRNADNQKDKSVRQRKRKRFFFICVRMPLSDSKRQRSYGVNLSLVRR